MVYCVSEGRYIFMWFCFILEIREWGKLRVQGLENLIVERYGGFWREIGV